MIAGRRRRSCAAHLPDAARRRDRSTRALPSGTAPIVHVADVLDDPATMPRTSRRAGGFRSVLAVPMLREGQRIGVDRRRPARTRAVYRTAGRRCSRPSPTRPSSRSRTCGCSRNCRRARRELTQSVGELKALGEVGQAVSSTLDLETVLTTIVSRATQLAGMDGGAIYEYDESARGVLPAHGGQAARRARRGAARDAASARARARWASWRSPASRSRSATSPTRPSTRAVSARCSSAWATGRCSRCRCCARTICSAAWSSTGSAPANSRRR